MITPRVSVVTIFLNAEKFIREAIKSVFEQTYRDWELLLVDDGSTDQSTALARWYCERYPEKVRYLEHENHENRGMSAARNLGVRVARGEYIAFLDSDDVWLPQVMQEQVSILDSQPDAGMLYGTSAYWYSWTGLDEDTQRDFTPSVGVESPTLFSPPTLLIAYLKDQNILPCPCSFLIRQSLLRDVGGFEERFRTLYEDQVFLAKACLKAPVFVSTMQWGRYRQHSDSCCAVALREGPNSPDNPISARRVYLSWLEGYLSEQRIVDTELWQALRKEQELCEPHLSL